MNWEHLYSTDRTGLPRNTHSEFRDSRNAFLRDYDRIVFSSAFRRLQNKTQVFPLPGSVFVHNRLTHSLEVACVGRSIARAVGEAIAEKHGELRPGFSNFYRYELETVIAAACLAHDIGNPPFGHSGEDAIRSFFCGLSGEQRSRIHGSLRPNQIADLERFEGNANAFRTLTHNFNEPETGGYRLTFPTLAAIVKYPSSSSEGFNKDKGLIATKKAGYFDPEIPVFAQIAEALGVPAQQGFEHVYARHPFVFLTEAADDICYRVIDLEDAHRLDILSFDRLGALFLPFFDDEHDYYSRDYIEKKMSRINNENQKVQYIRARWISLMIGKLARAFMEHEPDILSGNLQKDLLTCLPEKDRQLINEINRFSVKHVYNYKSVVEIEIAGYNVIGGLLREFVTAVLSPGLSKSAKIIKLVSEQFHLSLIPEDLYLDIMSLLDFIAGMTDLYAIDLYRKITGISVPEIR
jgi:dGTPase